MRVSVPSAQPATSLGRHVNRARKGRAGAVLRGASKYGRPGMQTLTSGVDFRVKCARSPTRGVYMRRINSPTSHQPLCY